MFTKEQESVIKARIRNKYIILGQVKSKINGLPSVILAKGKHTVVINSLGYDEYVSGPIYNLEPLNHGTNIFSTT